MPSHPSPRQSVIALCLVAGTLLCGCGTGAYEKKYAATLDRLRRETPFRVLHSKPVTDLPNPAVTLRIPLVFQEGESHAFDETSPEPKNPQEPLDPYRVQPHYLMLRGFQRTYEGFAKVPGRQSGSLVTKSFYLYIAAVPTVVTRRGKPTGKSLTAQNLADELRAQLVKHFKAGVGQWEKVEILTPEKDGATRTWMRLKATGQDYYHIYDKNVAQYKFEDKGVCLLYLYSTPNYLVVLGWKASEDVAKAIQLEKLAEITAGTVEVSQ